MGAPPLSRTLLSPTLVGLRQVSVSQQRNLARERQTRDSIGVVVPHSKGAREVVRLLHPLLQHRSQLTQLTGVTRVLGYVAQLPGIAGHVVQLQPCSGCLEQASLGRGQPAGLRTCTEGLE